MEYLEHGNLLRYLTSPLPELEVRNVTSQVLEGLKFMHGNGFVHRDLKPGVSVVPRLINDSSINLTEPIEYHGSHSGPRVVREDRRLRD